jgi:hypothetical protein
MGREMTSWADVQAATPVATEKVTPAKTASAATEETVERIGVSSLTLLMLTMTRSTLLSTR